MLLYNIHAIMKKNVLSTHRSNGFVATHAIGQINLSQRVFLEIKAVLSFDRLLYLWRRKVFSSNFLCIFWMLVNPLQKIRMIVMLSF